MNRETTNQNKFRLRRSMLFMCVTFMVIMCVWLGLNAYEYHREQSALEAIRSEEIGLVFWETDYDRETEDFGALVYADTDEFVHLFIAIRWSGPEWLKRPMLALGIPWFQRVVRIEMHLAGFDDRVVEPLTRLRYLESITFVDTAITNGGMTQLTSAHPDVEIILAEANPR